MSVHRYPRVTGTNKEQFYLVPVRVVEDWQAEKAALAALRAALADRALTLAMNAGEEQRQGQRQ